MNFFGGMPTLDIIKCIDTQMNYSPQFNKKSGSHKHSARIGPMLTDYALNAAQSNVLHKLV